MFDQIPVDTIDPNAIDQTAKTGGLLPEGKYHVRLEGVGGTTAKTTGRQGEELTFVVLAGPFAGMDVKETIWASDNEKGANRLTLFAHRLGGLTIDPKTKKYVRVPGKDGFSDLRGAEVVVQVAHKEYTRQDKTTGKIANLTFGGIWTLDDKEVKDTPKAKAGSKPPVAKAKTVDTSGI